MTQLKRRCESLLLALLTAGCVAELGGSTPLPGASGGSAGANTSSGGTDALGPAPQGQACDGLTTRRLRRLSGREYTNVVRDLLGETAAKQVATALPFEPRLAGFDNQDGALFVSPAFQTAVADLAQSLAATADPTALAPCPGGASAACLDQFATSFATKAYGRIPTADELVRLRTVTSSGQDYATSVRLVVEYVLQSPHTLYLSELGALDAVPTQGQPLRLTAEEVASQLSFLLLDSRPDEALRQAAASTGFSTPEDIEREATRLLAGPNALQALHRFVTGWFDLDQVALAPKSAEVFPQLTDEVVVAMQQELDTFIDSQLRAGGKISDFLSAVPNTVAPALMPIYGADYDPARGFDPKHRVGMLSLPGVLTYHASDQHSGPVERGLFVRRQLLCTEIPPPPQNVLDRIAANPVDDADTSRTTRQKFQAHLDDPTCAGCHQNFDPIGFGMEDMDGIGRYRTTENGLAIDATGALTGTDVDGPFTGAAELTRKLAQSKLLEACTVQHFFRFANARAAEAGDACVVKEWADQLSASGGKIPDLIRAYVAHRTFALRKDDR